MAPKRSAQPPPPSPPAGSSEETTAGSGSEEEEEEIAHSPPPAAPKSIAPPPQKDQESDASDEDEAETDEEEEEEEEDKANHVIPSSATKNPPPPPPTREESDTSDEEEEGEEEGEEEAEADDEVPQAKPAPNQKMDAKGAKRPSAPFQRTWSTDDELRILEALAAHRQEHGTLPQTDVLANALSGKLDNSGCSLSELQNKVKSLQSKNTKTVKKGVRPSNDHDRRLFDLFKTVWPSATKVAANGGAGTGREPGEICELYPYLAEEVKALEKAHPGLFKREFTMIDDSKASALNEKIKKQRVAQMKLHMRRHDLTKEVTKTLMDLAE